jgi:hypothetical protein
MFKGTQQQDRRQARKPRKQADDHHRAKEVSVAAAHPRLTGFD